MISAGTSHGAVTVINAIPCGIGATIGVDLRTTAVFDTSGDSRVVRIANAPGEDTLMAEVCVSNAYRMCGLEEPAGWKLTVESEIPVSRGLKSSSSACNAILKAVFSELGQDADRLDIVRLGVECAREAGVTVTGAFDDACGCEFGGLVMTENFSDSILSRSGIGDFDVVIHVPSEKIRKDSLPVQALHSKADEARKAVGIAMSEPFKAMTINGRLVAEAMGLDNSLAEQALDEGALGAGISGTGPAIAMVVSRGKGAGLAETLGLDPKETILTTTRCRA